MNTPNYSDKLIIKENRHMQLSFFMIINRIFNHKEMKGAYAFLKEIRASRGNLDSQLFKVGLLMFLHELLYMIK